MLTPHEALAQAEAARDALYRTTQAATDAWRRDVATLGREPAIEPEPRPPVAPVRSRPADGAVAEARLLIERNAEVSAVYRTHLSSLTAAEARATETAAEAERASKVAAKTTALLDAARRAPSDIAREQIAALGLGDGPLQVTFPERVNRQTPAIVVTMGGRPWHRASRGLRVLGSLLLRVAIRDAAAKTAPVLRWLPIGVDDVNALDGGTTPLPTVPGPTVALLTTAKGSPLTVRPA